MSNNGVTVTVWDHKNIKGRDIFVGHPMTFKEDELWKVVQYNLNSLAKGIFMPVSYEHTNSLEIVDGPEDWKWGDDYLNENDLERLTDEEVNNYYIKRYKEYAVNLLRIVRDIRIKVRGKDAGADRLLDSTLETAEIYKEYIMFPLRAAAAPPAPEQRREEPKRVFAPPPPPPPEEEPPQRGLWNYAANFAKGCYGALCPSPRPAAAAARAAAQARSLATNTRRSGRASSQPRVRPPPRGGSRRTRKRRGNRTAK
jgi:hypothetical protein